MSGTSHSQEETSPAGASLISFMPFSPGHMLAKLTGAVGAIVLCTNVLVVFASVIFRYVFHDPLHWAEEVARALMVALVFSGAATSMARGRHLGVDLFLGGLSKNIRTYIAHASCWILCIVSIALLVSSVDLFYESMNQSTPTGLPQTIYIAPVVFGTLVMSIISIEHVLGSSLKIVFFSGLAIALLATVCFLFVSFAPEDLPAPSILLISCFVLGVVAGVPIAFTLGISAFVFFMAEPGLPLTIYSQQFAAGVDHFALLAVPFFLLAGAAMEVNGMSARLVELIVRGMGRLRGGMSATIVLGMAFFSGISGSKLADVAAVGGVLMPAMRRSKQNPADAAGLFAASAVMAEAIPPCVNLIIMAFVANLSVSGLFVAGLVPAGVLALVLVGLAIFFGKKVDVTEAYPVQTPRFQLFLGAAVGLVMILMIGRGVVAGIATPTEISAFAVVYAIVVGWLAFRELTVRSAFKLFVDCAAQAGMLMFIVAAAGGISYSLTFDQIPHQLAEIMIEIGKSHGAWLFMILAILLLVVFGAVLEGAPALIIFGPILVPIAEQLGFDPLHFGIIMVLAMGFGLFAPPVGLGLYATCATCGVTMNAVVRPMSKYMAAVGVMIVILAFVPSITTWLPRALGY